MPCATASHEPHSHHGIMSDATAEKLHQSSCDSVLLPGIPPHVGIPSAFVLFDQIEIGNQRAVIHEAVFLDRGGNEFVGLVVVPAAFAHEAIVDENLFRSETPA